MFYLRKITGSKVEMNFCLGESYTLVLKANSPEEFEKAMADHPQYEEAYGYVTWRTEGRIELLPLFQKQQNYIVSENGVTYDNVTLKK